MVMGCLTIETEVLLANFFGSPENPRWTEDGVPIVVIEKCAKTLANNLPGYVFYDLSRRRLWNVVNENREYVLSGENIIYKGGEIDREKYNKVYASDISEKMSTVVDSFFKFRLYEKEIKLLMPVRA